MTYRELYEKMIYKYADEKGIVRGKPVMLLYRISKAAEANGLDSIVNDELREAVAMFK